MSLNIDAFYFINNNLANPLFDAVMPILSNAGGFVTLLVICLAVIVLSKHFHYEKILDISKICLFSLLLAGIIAACLKLCFHSPRPFTVLEHVRQLTVPSEPNSFPSGHTSSTLSIITVLVWMLRERKVLVCILIVFAFLVGFSRIYVGVHYPFDVVVGGAVGIISGVVVLVLKKRLEV